MTPGLCASLGSLAEAMSSAKKLIPVFVYYRDIDLLSRERMVHTFHSLNTKAEIEFREIDINAYLGLLPLQGDHMTYARLGLPRLLKDFDRILYLDSDMLFSSRIMSLIDIELNDALFAASGVGTLGNSLENRFYIEILQLKASELSFNAGLLLINGKQWRSRDIEQQAIAFGMKHREHCKSADQTILNALYHREFLPLPETFNSYCGPWCDGDAEAAVSHFVGMPKPWDLFGSFIHRSYSAWWEAARRGGIETLPWSTQQWLDKLRRAWIGRRSLARAAMIRSGLIK